MTAEPLTCPHCAAPLDLRTTEQVAAALGISAARVRQLAQQLGRGWDLGHGTRLFAPADIAALRNRKTAPGPRKRFRRVPIDDESDK